MANTRTVKKLVIKKNRPRCKDELDNSGKPRTAHAYYCGWCYSPKLGTNHRCPNCSSFMTTSLPQSRISHVYVEDIPA